jgi:hypothetical protein
MDNRPQPGTQTKKANSIGKKQHHSVQHDPCPLSSKPAGTAIVEFGPMKQYQCTYYLSFEASASFGTTDFFLLFF